MSFSQTKTTFYSMQTPQGRETTLRPIGSLRTLAVVFPRLPGRYKIQAHPKVS